MLYMMEWSIKSGCAEKAVHRFLDTGAPMPTGLTQVGRYHAPGSAKGWLLVDTDDVGMVYKHASEWAELLDWTTTPVVTDKVAGEMSSSVWKNVD